MQTTAWKNTAGTAAMYRHQEEEEYPHLGIAGESTESRDGGQCREKSKKSLRGGGEKSKKSLRGGGEKSRGGGEKIKKSLRGGRQWSKKSLRKGGEKSKK